MSPKLARWEEALVGEGAPIVDAIHALDRSTVQICLVVDDQRRLVGTVTDGDIRRGILKAITLDSPVEAIMNRTPKTTSPRTPRAENLRVMNSLKIRQIPVIDSGGHVVGLEFIDGILSEEAADYPNWVVLMAGGMGKRLMPLTEDKPKPLLEVGGVPILEVVLGSFLRHRFNRFMLSVNYRADMIKAHFGDGSRLGAEILYLEEDEPLGTAGPLGLIPTPPDEPIIVMNGDILTKVNVVRLLDFHREQGADATMAVGEYDVQVPFGVVQTDGGRITGIEEKPAHRFFVNAGMYVLEPAVLHYVKAGEPLDMPDLFRRMIEDGLRTNAFPVREYWLDIGRHDDFRKANREYPAVFDDDPIS